MLTIVKGLSDILDDDNDFEAIATQGVDSSFRINLKCEECGRKWNTSIKTQVKKDGIGGYLTVGCPHYNTIKRKKEAVPYCNEVDAIIRFWDEQNSLDPATTRSNSREKAHFICKSCGYEWTTIIAEQEKGTGKCKCCELHLVTKKGVTDVFTIIPEAQKYYDFEKNMEIDIYSIALRNHDTLISWKCPDCGYEWQSTLATRVRGKKGSYSFAGCQKCYFHSTNRITPVASKPELVKYWDFEENKDLDINLISVHSTIPVHWRCKTCNYKWVASIKGRNGSSIGCPFCEGKHQPVITGQNDVLTLRPELAAIYDFEENERKGIDIYSLGPCSQSVAHFICDKCGNDWDSRISYRIKKENGRYRLVGCPKCSNMSFRQIPYSQQYPDLAKMYLEDLNGVCLDSIRGANAVLHTQYHWKCLTCGEEFESTLTSMTQSSKYPTKGCPYCSRTKFRKGESFAELHPELMDEYDPSNTIDAYKFFANCKDFAKWTCRKCNFSWEASFALRHVGGGICPVCNRTTLIKEINSFAAVYPDMSKFWADSNKRCTDEVFSDSSGWFNFICPTCGNEYGSYIKDFVAEEDHHCPFCKGNKAIPGYNSFADKHPELLNELDSVSNYLLPLTPNEVLDNSIYKFWWVCRKDPTHKYFMSPKTRLMYQKRNRKPCLYCRGQRRKLNHFIDPYAIE